jgi:hypothetical protein
MKRKILASIVATIIATMSLCSCAQSRFFSSYASQPGVVTVYVSKAMIRLGNTISGKFVSGVDSKALSKIISSASSIEVLAADNSASPEVRKQLLSITDDEKYELLTEVTDGSNTTRIYIECADEDTVLRILIFNIDPEDINAISVAGKFSLSDLAEFANSSANSSSSSASVSTSPSTFPD